MKKTICILFVLAMCLPLLACTSLTSVRDEGLLTFDEWQKRFDYYHGIGERLSAHEWQQRWDETQIRQEERRIALAEAGCENLSMIEIVEDEDGQLILVITYCGHSALALAGYRAWMHNAETIGTATEDINARPLGNYRIAVQLRPVLGNNHLLYSIFPPHEIHNFNFVPAGFEGQFNITIATYPHHEIMIFIGSDLPINVEQVEAAELPFPNNRIEIPLGIWA
jgi:hypothetical protein